MEIAVIDDVGADRSKIIKITRQYWAEYGRGEPLHISAYSNGNDFVAALPTCRFELVLLDCCMDGVDGLQAAKALRQYDREAGLIFITASRDYAVDGYGVAASGYLVKPFTYGEFAHTLTAAQSRLTRHPAYLTVSTPQGTQRVLLDDIVWCDIDGHYMRLHLGYLGVLRVRTSFSRFSALLTPYPQFLVCYRSCLINMAHARKMDTLYFVMDTGESVPFRQRERGELLRQYSDYLFYQIREVDV